jgi:uncharacterized membrane protein YedE/YeeE
MTDQDISRLIYEVFASVAVISFLLGYVAQRTHFCTMGSVADVYLMGDWSRALQWIIATSIATLGFALLCLSQQINPTKTLYFSTKWYWASTSLGGLMFGIGMVLSSGCGLKTLVRTGSGNLKSLVVMLVMATFAFMTLKGVFGVLRVSTVDKLSLLMPGGANLVNLIGLDTSYGYGYLGVGLGLSSLFLILFSEASRQKHVLITGALVGALFVAIWWVSAHLGYVAEHPDTLEEVFIGGKSNKAEAFSFVAPVAYLFNWLEFFSDQSNVLSSGVISVFGVLLGSTVSSISNSSFKWEGFAKTDDLVSHLIGGALMGVGGVTAMGCSVGQGISGLSTLSLNAVSAVIFIVVGALSCLTFQSHRLDKQI